MAQSSTAARYFDRKSVRACSNFEAISDNVYRFSPVRALPEDLPRFHGTNERIAVKNYVELIAFYQRLLVNSASAQ